MTACLALQLLQRTSPPKLSSKLPFLLLLFYHVVHRHLQCLLLLLCQVLLVALMAAEVPAGPDLLRLSRQAQHMQLHLKCMLLIMLQRLLTVPDSDSVSMPCAVGFGSSAASSNSIFRSRSGVTAHTTTANGEKADLSPRDALTTPWLY